MYQVVHFFDMNRVNTAGTTLTRIFEHPDEAIGDSLINPRDKKKGARWSLVMVGINSAGGFMPLFVRTRHDGTEWLEHWYNAAKPACRELRKIRKIVGTL